MSLIKGIVIFFLKIVQTPVRKFENMTCVLINSIRLDCTALHSYDIKAAS